MLRGYRYRLYPTPEQEELLRQFVGVCRFIYNLALEQRQREWTGYRDCGMRLDYFQQSKELTQLRAEVDWIRAVPRWCEEQALRDLDAAYAAFFAGRGRYPSFCRKGDREAVRFHARDCRVAKLNARWATVRIPNIGEVKFRHTRAMGETRNVTVSCDGLGWHVSFACVVEVPEAAASHLPSVGIDRGVANTLALSTGEMLSLPKSLATVERQHRKAQRVLARRVRGSNRRRQALRRCARLAARRARIRRDWQHRASTDIARRFGAVVMEDLKIQNMTAKGTGKRGLNRSILNQGWGTFATLLAYKLEQRGGSLVLINPAYTSQTCSECGTIDRESRESQADFHCRHCGHHMHADENAARNILRLGNTQSLGVEGLHQRPREALTVDRVVEAA
jgi:putative transposase